MEKRTTPVQITKRLKDWWLCFWFWNILHYLLGLTATVGTVVIAATKGQALGPAATGHTTLAVAVAVSTAILTFAKASTKAKAYADAWRLLDSERVIYELDASVTEAKLAATLKAGETIIGKSD